MRWAASRRPRGSLLPQGACPAGCTPHSLFGCAKKRMRRARWKRKNRFWSQLCTCVQSCCTGVGVRWCLRVCDDLPTGAAGCGIDLNADSRGAGASWVRVPRRDLTSSSFPVSRCGAPRISVTSVPLVPLSARSASLRAGRVEDGKGAELRSAAFVFVFF